MKFILFITFLAISFIAVAALYEVNFINYSSPIPYSQINSITFTDFKGLKKPSQTLNGIQEFAFIKTSRKISFNSDNTVTATTYFHPSRSYVFNQHLRNPDLLSHELYHFHIAEYITRLLRKEISEYNGNLTSNKVESLRKKYSYIENEMQFNYDDQTDHSYAFKEQRQWQSIIDSNLKSLALFQNSIIILKK